MGIGVSSALWSVVATLHSYVLSCTTSLGHHSGVSWAHHENGPAGWDADGCWRHTAIVEGTPSFQVPIRAVNDILYHVSTFASVSVSPRVSSLVRWLARIPLDLLCGYSRANVRSRSRELTPLGFSARLCRGPADQQIGYDRGQCPTKALTSAIATQVVSSAGRSASTLTLASFAQLAASCT